VLLTSGEAKAEVDSLGAYVTRWAVGGRDIFYPKTELRNAKGELKTRGGCHVCLPNFDNGDRYNLPHHGFGRLVEWAVISQSSSSIALEINGSAAPKKYQNLQARLVYTLEEAKLIMLLWLKNTGAEPLEVDPAFHPYFLNDAPLYKLEQTNLPVTLVWSDNLDNYFCAEPTAGGRSFKEGEPNQLAPGEEKKYSLIINVLS
jgi:galactose mutarotase-like enzyme